MKKIQKTLGRIWQLYKPFRLAIGAALVLALIAQGVTLLTPYLLGKLINGFNLNLPTEALLKIALFIFIAKFLEVSVNYTLSILEIRKFEMDIKLHLAAQTLKHVSQFSIGQITNENSGFRQSIITKGENAVISIADLLITDLLPTIARTIVTAIALLWLSPPVCAIVITGVFLFIATSYRLNSKMIAPVKRHRGIQNKLDTQYSEVMRNMRLIMVNAQESGTIRDYIGSYEKLSADVKNEWTSYSIKSCVQREPFSIGTLILTIVCCIYLFKKENYSAGSIVTITSWTMMLISILGRVGPYQRKLTIWLSIAFQYFEMLDIPPAINIVKNPIRPEKIEGRIEFKNVSFSYPYIKKLDEESDGEHTDKDDEKGTLHNVSFTIEKGETCALVGHSGAGKSTIINLLLRAYDPDEGEILVDGHDLRLFDLTYLRKKIGYVEQQVRLWDETLRYNILYSLNGKAKQVTEESLEGIAARACIDKFYDRLGKKRFDTLIGENGIKLSGGEQQRVGIARALAKEPSILIFDEATNSLDNLNEALVQRAIKQSLEGKTGIIIAHRLSTVRRANKIIVLSGGRILDIGEHTVLLDRCSYYRDLVESEREALLRE